MGKNLIGSKYKGIDRQKDKEEDQKQIQEDTRSRYKKMDQEGKDPEKYKDPEKPRDNVKKPRL